MLLLLLPLLLGSGVDGDDIDKVIADLKTSIANSQVLSTSLLKSCIFTGSELNNPTVISCLL